MEVFSTRRAPCSKPNAGPGAHSAGASCPPWERVSPGGSSGGAPFVQKGPRAEGLRSHVSSVSGAWHGASAGRVSPTRIEVDPRAIGLVRSRAAASVWSTGRGPTVDTTTAPRCRVVSYCLTLLELHKSLLLTPSFFDDGLLASRVRPARPHRNASQAIHHSNLGLRIRHRASVT
jgi:hypothetical protein